MASLKFSFAVLVILGLSTFFMWLILKIRQESITTREKAGAFAIVLSIVFFKLAEEFVETINKSYINASSEAFLSNEALSYNAIANAFIWAIIWITSILFIYYLILNIYVAFSKFLGIRDTESERKNEERESESLKESESERKNEERESESLKESDKIYFLKSHKWHIFIVILLVIGIYTLNYSSNLNENLEGQLYEFNFNLKVPDITEYPKKIVHLQNYSFYYDFTQNTGRISFYVGYDNWVIRDIDIYFPSVVDNTTIKINKIKNGNEEELSYKWFTQEYYGRMKGDSTRLYIYEFDSPFNRETINIDFKSDLKPKGRFSFWHQNDTGLHTTSGEGNVRFILGDDYECRGGCIYAPLNIKETYRSFDRDLRIEFETEKGIYYAFKLNAISRNTVFWKNVSMAFGISLIVAVLSSILMILYPDEKEKNFKKLLNNITEITGIGKTLGDKIKRYFK
ncbi:hypothetical protein GOV13_03010 [Candidatus Pacearchaeota archaeon]|nr:hypothetical protein [Candidatus Pacearchaeota archaeon]